MYKPSPNGRVYAISGDLLIEASQKKDSICTAGPLDLHPETSPV